MAIKTNLKNLAPRAQAYARKMPLVSGGYTNRKAWPDGMITIKPWDTEVDEWFMQAQEMGEEDLMVGLLDRLVGWNGATVDDIVLTEMMSVLLMARSITTGGKLHYISHCPSCHFKEAEALIVPDELEPVGKKEPDYPGYDLVTLPECLDVVAIRPLLVADDRMITHRDPPVRAKIPDGLLRKIMPVIAVNEGKPESLEELLTWYLALAPGDARYLVEQEDLFSPQLNRRIPHKCSQCSREFFHIIKFDQEFFRSGSARYSGTSMAANVPAGVDGKRLSTQPAGGAGRDAQKV